MNSISYKGFDIEKNFYGAGEYSVQYIGDDVIFPTEEEAMSFIDAVSREEGPYAEHD